MIEEVTSVVAHPTTDKTVVYIYSMMVVATGNAYCCSETLLHKHRVRRSRLFLLIGHASRGQITNHDTPKNERLPGPANYLNLWASPNTITDSELYRLLYDVSVS